MKGKIKWFNFKKNYGFIVGEDCQDYFFHGSEKVKSFLPRENDPVIFDVYDGSRGLQAKNVREQI